MIGNGGRYGAEKCPALRKSTSGDPKNQPRKRDNLETGPAPHLAYSDFMKVFSVATPEEQKQLDPIRLRKRSGLLRRGDRESAVAAGGQ